MSSSAYPNGNDNPPPDPTDVANPPNNSHGNGASSSSPNCNYIPSSLSILNDIASSLSTDNMPFEFNRSPATPSLVNYSNSSRDNSELVEGEIIYSSRDNSELVEGEIIYSSRDNREHFGGEIIYSGRDNSEHDEGEIIYSSRDNSEHVEGEIIYSNLDGQYLEEHEPGLELGYTPFIPGLDFCAEDCPCLGEIRQLKADVQTLRDELRQYRSELALVDGFRRVGMTDDVVEGV